MPITSLQAVCGFSWVTVDLQSVVIWYNHSERSRRQWNQECFELKIALNSASRTLHAQFTCALESKKYLGSVLPWYGSSLWSSKSASLVLSLSDPTSFSTWCPLIGSSADEGFHLTLSACWFSNAEQKVIHRLLAHFKRSIQFTSSCIRPSFPDFAYPRVQTLNDMLCLESVNASDAAPTLSPSNPHIISISSCTSLRVNGAASPNFAGLNYRVTTGLASIVSSINIPFKIESYKRFWHWFRVDFLSISRQINISHICCSPFLKTDRIRHSITRQYQIYKVSKMYQ